MNESILQALMQLFALVANVSNGKISRNAKSVVESYLTLQFNQHIADKYLEQFDLLVEKFHYKNENTSVNQDVSLDLQTLKNICKQINEGLNQKEKVVVFIRLLEFTYEDRRIDKKESVFIKHVAKTFNISDNEQEVMMLLVLNDHEKTEYKDQFLIINSDETPEKTVYTESGAWFDRNKPKTIKEFHHIQRESLSGQIILIHIPSTNLFVFKYFGNDKLVLNGHGLVEGHIYTFDTGSILRGPKIQPIYFSEVAACFQELFQKAKINFCGHDIEYKFGRGENGIRRFSFSEESGQLIGILGGSGVGKSTLLNVLNGNLSLKNGHIQVNGYDLQKDKLKLEGLVGHVPQDDLLIEELSVFDNLYFNARLCLGHLSKKDIHQRVQKLLQDLDLERISHLKVGSPLKQLISGGERKRLNIALELIREPSILFVDEPTSGLSSMDSENVMLMLKELSLKGKLVMLTIHQPSSDIFKQFDKIWVLDMGGHIIYTGNPIDAVVYFKGISQQVNAEESECPTCGNVDADQILQIVENRLVDEFGKYTRERRITPKQWYRHYLENLQRNQPKPTEKSDLPPAFSHIPMLTTQFRVFLKRDLLTKLSNLQYLLITFIEAPLLALILGYFSKYLSKPGQYTFADNVNIPAFLFMSVVVALFLGMIVSAEEIIRDRKILKREAFLHLSKFTYINSKVIILFTVSAIQTLSFVLVANYVLEIQGMVIGFWLVLFTTSCFANLIGLNISSALDSVVAIYITIPFILVPQLLFSGTIVSFDKLHEKIASVEYTPVLGDIMTSRWAFEALAVTQFKHNNYQKNFYEIEKTLSHASYNIGYLIPRLTSKVDVCLGNVSGNINQEETLRNFKILQNEIQRLWTEADKMPFWDIKKLTPKYFDAEVAEDTRDYLEYLYIHYRSVYREASDQKDALYAQLVDQLGSEGIFKLKQANHNTKLEEWVTNKNELVKFIETDDQIFQKKDPIYMVPTHNWGRAHFYAPEKLLNGQYVDTWLFNIAFIWLTVSLLYILLVLDLLRHFLVFMGRIRLNQISFQNIADKLTIRA